ncbi:Probable Co/Zn/Cd efflux system membrane fusion protein [hydrothermal vent metagenome]|uniref:Probable Co/Zn/Cd efflux system membrane fusion protein n=1 Tax=hydrothermal vent metagenome TaxID=652676 RepID=A0A3B0QZW1_9ZZZZ
MKFFKYFLRVLLPVVVLVVCFFIARQIISGKKKIKLHAAPPVVSVVEAEAAVKTDFRVVIKSHGTVRARTESAVVPEVSGRVVEIYPNFRAGGFLEEGELILSLDPRNYEIEVALKEAELAKASQLLAEEEARAAIALRNWERLRGEQAPTPLAVRRPQLMSARAELKAARAKLNRAELDLERTSILAPFSGRVLEKTVDLGEYVTAGNAVARIYAVDFAEIRLPLSARELEFVDTREFYRAQRGQKAGGGQQQGPLADIVASHRGREYKWSARIVRSEGAIDEKSRQLFVVAEVADPYGREKTAARSGGFLAPPLKVGEFVEARIQGRILKDVFVIPRRALRIGTELFIIKDGLLERREVNVVWKDADNIVVDSGLKEGEFVVTTPSVYMKAGKFKIVTTPPAGRQSSIKSKKLTQSKITADKTLPVVKSLPAPLAAEQSLIGSKKPTQSKETQGKTLSIKKTSNSGGWDLSELDNKPAPAPPAVGQSPLGSKKPTQSRETLGITLPVVKPRPGKTTLGITLPITKETTSVPRSVETSRKKAGSEASGWIIPAFDEKKLSDKEVVR